MNTLSPSRSVHTAGVTLIELLIGMALIGILLVVIMQLQSGATRASASMMTAGQRIEEQNAAVTYIADRFRGSLDWTVPASLTLSGTASCTLPSTDGTCMAFVSPETTYGDTSGDITRYVLLAYRMEARTTFTDRRPDAWADAEGTQVIREYRYVLPCGTACTGPNVTVPTSAVWASSVVADGFTLTGQSGTLQPFTLSKNKLTLRVRSQFADGSTKKYFPMNTPPLDNGATVNTVIRRN